MRERFTAVDIGQYGSVSDGGVFSDTPVGERILQENANLPTGKIKLQNSTVAVPAFFVADQAFPLSLHIMRPYPGKQLSKGKQIFNYRLSRTRGLIENAFGILTMRWKIFRSPISIRNLDDIDNVILLYYNYVHE